MTLAEIRQTAYDLLNVDLNQYSETKANASINRHYDSIFNRLMLAQGAWTINGSTYTTNIVANQIQYDVLVEASQIERVEVNFSGATNGFTNCYPFDVKSDTMPISNNGFPGVTLAPSFRLSKGSMFIYPVPINNVTAGIRIWTNDLPAQMNADTDSPAMLRPFRIAMAYGAAMDYCLSKRPDQAAQFESLMEKKIQEAEQFYSSRNKTSSSKITTFSYVNDAE